MNLVFEKLIQSYLDDGLGQSLNFLPKPLAENLKNNLILLSKSEKLTTAGIGLNNTFQEDKGYRKDKIVWIENQSKNEYEKAFFVLMDSFVQFLNETCFTGITNYEFHYALFEAGSF